jgi:hypothetical protein
MIMRTKSFAMVFLTALTMALSGASCTDTGSQTPSEIVSDFTDGTDGWMIEGDAQMVEPEHSGDGGVGDSGYIFARDNVTGGVWYFVAPSKHIGNKSAFFNGTMRFYLLQISAQVDQFNAKDVIIDGGAHGMIHCYHAVYPGSNWTLYEIPLNEGGQWLNEDETPATSETIKNVLSNVQKLSIRGEFESGSDTGGLDSFSYMK